MARDYFTIIGTLSSSEQGLSLLDQCKIFEYLAPISVMPGRDDLCHLIMTNLDYNMFTLSPLLSFSFFLWWLLLTI